MLHRKLVVFTGKGGVGKTSLSAAFALAAARNGKQVLLAEVRASKRIPPLFGIEPEGDGPRRLKDGITWINLTPSAALETYAMNVLRLRSVYRAVFEQRAVRRFLRAVPSLAEILVLGYLVHLLEGDEYQLAVLDAPSTGPGALMLKSPRAVLETAPGGALLEGVKWIQNFLNDPEQTVVNIAVTPEELPVSEAIDLFHRLKDDLRLPLGFVFANRVLTDPFPPNCATTCQLVGAFDLGHALAQASELLRSRLQLQETYLDRLRAGVDLPTIALPEVIDRANGSLVIDTLTESFSRLLGEVK